jgi:hypothetical protein
MKRLKKSAVILSLVEALLEKGSWCGETHIQKCTYFLQELVHVPLGFDFILYKHGPYSFDLSDKLMAMRADEMLNLKSHPPYGPSIVPGENGDRLKRLFPRTIQKYKERVEFVAKELGTCGVAELERIATALYVTLNDKNWKKERIDKKAFRIHKLKPHISLEQAQHSLQRGFEIRDRAVKEKLVQAT